MSDRSALGEQEDASGPALVELLREARADIVAHEVVSDDLDPLADKLREFAERSDVNLIITTGGTGLGPRGKQHSA